MLGVLYGEERLVRSRPNSWSRLTQRVPCTPVQTSAKPNSADPHQRPGVAVRVCPLFKAETHSRVSSRVELFASTHTTCVYTSHDHPLSRSLGSPQRPD